MKNDYESICKVPGALCQQDASCRATPLQADPETLTSDGLAHYIDPWQDVSKSFESALAVLVARCTCADACHVSASLGVSLGCISAKN